MSLDPNPIWHMDTCIICQIWMPTHFLSQAATTCVERQLHSVLFGTLPRRGHHFRKPQLTAAWWSLGGRSARRLTVCSRCIHRGSVLTAPLCLSVPALKHTLLITRYFSLSWVVLWGCCIDIHFLWVVGFIIYPFHWRIVIKYVWGQGWLILIEMRISPVKWNPNALLSPQACQSQPAVAEPLPGPSTVPAKGIHVYVPECVNVPASLVPVQAVLSLKGPRSSSHRSQPTLCPHLSSSHPSFEACASAVHRLHCHLPNLLEMTHFFRNTF